MREGLQDLLDDGAEVSLADMLKLHVRESADFRKAVLDSMEDLRARMETTEAAITDMVPRLDANTMICSDIQTAVATGKFATKVIKWIGGIALALASVAWAWREAVHYGSGGPPPGIGPQ